MQMCLLWLRVMNGFINCKSVFNVSLLVNQKVHFWMIWIQRKQLAICVLLQLPSRTSEPQQLNYILRMLKIIEYSLIDCHDLENHLVVLTTAFKSAPHYWYPRSAKHISEQIFRYCNLHKKILKSVIFTKGRIRRNLKTHSPPQDSYIA